MNAPLAKEQIALLMSDSLTYRSPGVEGTDGTTTDARPAPRSLAQRIGSFVSGLLAMPRRRAVLDELSSLSDRELADVGLSRSELSRVFDPQFAAARERKAAPAVLDLLASGADEERHHSEICAQLAEVYGGESVERLTIDSVTLPRFNVGDDDLETTLLVAGMCCLNETVATAWISVRGGAPAPGAVRSYCQMATSSSAT